MLYQPPWVRFEAPLDLHFAWDDADGGAPHLGFDEEAAEVVRISLYLEPRARMALAVALTEWTVWRFESLRDDSAPASFIEAAWSATADPRYLRFFELTRPDWVGPVDGPLWFAITHLRHALAVGVDFPRDLLDALAFLTRLALYVQPTREPLRAWLPPVLDRLRIHFPKSPEDPLADLFARDPSSRMGPLVSRDVFNPALPMQQGAGRVFLQHVLMVASQEQNPYLATPDDLADTRFSGTPYVLR